MKRTAGKLADGREIIYFDERADAGGAAHTDAGGAAHTDAGGAEHAARDARDLPGRPPVPDMRYDPLRREWVAVASHRQGRTHLPPPGECPLCPSRPGYTTEIPAGDYDVVVFENRFPSFATGGPGAGPGAEPPSGGGDAAQVGSVLGSPAGAGHRGAVGSSPANAGDRGGLGSPAGAGGRGVLDSRAGAGRCEVVCFTAEHTASFAELPPSRVRTVVEAWADRTAALARMPGVEQVFCFENRGEEIGVTLHHPHGQIYAYPFVTPRTQKTLDAARAHRERTGRNLLTDVLAAEQEAGTRVVTRGEHWTAFVPFAARWPVEVHLYPHRQVPDIAALSDTERDGFAEVYLDVLGRLDRIFDGPLPYVAAWHQAPAHRDRDLAYLHLEVFSVRRGPDRLKYLAGSESAMGVFINDVPPEDVARRLRDLSA